MVVVVAGCGMVVVVVEVAVVVGSGLVQGCIGCAHPSIKVRREDDP